MIRRFSAGVFFACFCSTLPAASAQYVGGGSPSVSGSGTAIIERPAETLRVEIDLLAKGKDLKDALGILKQRRKAAEEQLAKLGADAKSVRFGAPQISAPDNDQQRQMQMMIRSRMMQRRGGRRPADKAAVKPPVTVTMSLIAQWPLKPAEPEGMLLAAHDLEEKIKEADLAGRKAAEELSPEEAELAEENEEDSEQMFYGGQQQAKPGEPRFIYVAKISDEDRAKACAEAFEYAKADAARLTDAAHAKLGDLQNLSGMNESGTDPEAYQEWGNYQYQMIQRAQRQSTATGTEAVGPHPGTLKYHVTVTASFGLK